MNIHKPDLTDFAEFSAQMGEWIAAKHTWGVGSRVQCEGRWGTIVRREAHYPSKEWDDGEYTLVKFDGDKEPVVTYLGDLVGEPPSPIQYLDLTGQWERFGEWLDWIECRNPDPKAKNLVDAMTLANVLDFAEYTDVEGDLRWPPQNIVLLGRVSTQGEVDSFGCRVSSDPLREWRTAALLTPVEELKISFLVSAKMAGKVIAPGVKQIIVKQPELTAKVQNLQDMILIEEYPSYVNSIIRQVREIRGECEDCGGDGLESDPVFGERWCICETCGHTGLAPGLPRLLIEGDERYQERIEP